MKVRAKTKRQLLDAKKRLVHGGQLLPRQQLELVEACLKLYRAMEAIGLRALAEGLVDGRGRRRNELMQEIREIFTRFSKAEYGPQHGDTK